MVLNTASVGAAVTPTVIETWFSHYLNRKPLHHKPTAHISYHEGLNLVRRFLLFASNNTVDDVQAFTGQWVPIPSWVKVDKLTVPDEKLAQSASYINKQLGPAGVAHVGGSTWWQWRRDEGHLHAEWIEMSKDFNERKRSGQKPTRIILYIHGGAYYFGGVDEHRYQMQRHARKLRARLFAPRYRLAPQFPFPCGLQDALAAYLYLLERHDPSTILIAGDSAGGGMSLSLLITIRDQGLPLPAGGILLSPWVDLTHSFPSLAGDGALDYIPAHGFVHKPSMAWPPPNGDDLKEIAERGANLVGMSKKWSPSGPPEATADKKELEATRARGFSVTTPAEAASSGNASKTPVANPKPEPGTNLSIMLDGKLIEIKDQIQLYAANHLLTHPLVSPALQPSLGGLCPILIQVGGGELLRDEQIYIAHKMAHPLQYLPPTSAHQRSEEAIQAEAQKYGPTDVQLQLWEDLCHVTHTLSWTRPAKYMYRSVAQFGAWALAHAQDTEIDIIEDDDISVMSKSSDESPVQESSDTIDRAKKAANAPQPKRRSTGLAIPTTSEPATAVGRPGDPIPAFIDHMIRQRIDRHGNIYDLGPESSLPALHLDRDTIGVIKEGPVRKWMAVQSRWSQKFAKEKRAVQRKRMAEMSQGYVAFPGENPPPTALAGRRLKNMPKEKKPKRSWGLSMWSGWGSSQDSRTIEKEEKGDVEKTTDGADQDGGAGDGAVDPGKRARAVSNGRSKERPNLASRSRSRHSTVTDRGQAGPRVQSPSAAPAMPSNTLAVPEQTTHAPREVPAIATIEPFPPVIATGAGGAESMAHGVTAREGDAEDDTVIPPTRTTSTRPMSKKEGVAYPFKLAVPAGAGHERNASTLTLMSANMSVDDGKSVEASIDSAAVDGAAETPGTAGKPSDEDGVPTGNGVVSEGKRLLGRDPDAVAAAAVTAPVIAANNANNTASNTGEEVDAKELERPGVERFVTAAETLDGKVV